MDFSKISQIIVSPGIFQNHKILKKAKDENIKIISEVELALSFIKNKKIIAVTGTNGKTTTCKLLEHVFNENNVKAIACGNIGKTVSEVAFENFDVLIVELSSFQLLNIFQKFFDLAFILNISDDHLDYHQNFENYKNAKLKLSKLMKNDAELYVDENVLKYFSKNLKIFSLLSFIKQNKFDKYFELLYTQRRDLSKQSILAAIIASFYLKLDMKEVLKGLKSFKTLEHRLEFVRKIKGVNFYNDSKATNPSSVIHAVNTIEKNIILICGGKNKGFTFKCFNKEFKNKVKYIIATGENALQIKNDLNDFVEILENVEMCIKRALEIGIVDDNVLFSCGSASFDKYKNYQERGEEFKFLVNRGEKIL